MVLLVVVALISVLVGLGLGILVASRTDRPNPRTRRLESELEALRAESKAYRQSALEQFTQTAERFRELDEAYVALHRQLAESAHRLCGTEVGKMIEAPRTDGELPDGEDEREDGSDRSTGADERASERGAIPWSGSLEDNSAGEDAAFEENAGSEETAASEEDNETASRTEAFRAAREAARGNGEPDTPEDGSGESTTKARSAAD